LSSHALPPSPVSLDAIVTLQSPTKRRWRIGLVAAAALGIVAVVWITLDSRTGDQPNYRTAPVERGDLIVTVTATGVLHPLTQVDVGSEVSGVIKTVNVDFNDRVTKGQLLALLDTDQLRARLLQAKASLASAQAGRRQAAATVHETDLNFHRCERLAENQMC